MEISVGDPIRHRDSLFSYKCNICNKCCHGKGIQVNPYETMRLAECLTISTTDFREKYLYHQFLRFKENSDACVFLDEKGCTVHKDRPLSCRLYPLGRARLENDEEVFIEVTPHPESKGEYGQELTVDTYLKGQGTEPYLKAEKAYLEVVQRMAAAALEMTEKYDPDNMINQPAESNADWILDPDPVVMNYCKWKNIKFPSGTEHKLEIHLKALYAWVDGEWDPLAPGL